MCSAAGPCLVMSHPINRTVLMRCTLSTGLIYIRAIMQPLCMQALEAQAKGLPPNAVSAADVYAAVNAQADAARLLVARIQGLWERCGHPGDIPRISLHPQTGALTPLGQPPGYSSGTKRNSPLQSPGLFASPW